MGKLEVLSNYTEPKPIIILHKSNVPTVLVSDNDVFESNKPTCEVKPKKSFAQKLKAFFKKLTRKPVDYLISALERLVGIDEIPDMSLEEIQQNFKEIFMNDDISLEDTKAMLKRYNEIFEIEDKNEYVRALYKEAKKNYGLSHLNNSFTIGGPIFIGSFKYLNTGETNSFGDINISPKFLSRESLFNAVHHELRHLKQKYYAFNYSPEEYIKVNQNETINSGKKIPVAIYANFFGTPDINNVPFKYHEYAKKCLEAEKSYNVNLNNLESYENNFLEKDAYFAGDTMEKILESSRKNK